MRTVQFLREFGLDELCSRFAIRARRHGAHPQLVQLKYSQILSPLHEPVVQECRGLVVDEADDWRVVCRAYDKFFNLGEPNAAAVDWGSGRVYEKLDGSLITLYHYRGEWHAASSGLPDAAGMAHESGVTFAELFRRTWSRLGYARPGAGDAHLCFMFELMTPENRVITPHARPRVVLHGVRDLHTMRERDPEPIAAERGWECVSTLPLTCVEDCLAAAKSLSPKVGEGYVVRDAHFRRVKVKSPQYVALAHLKEGMTGRRILEIVRANESDEFLTYFPEFRPAYEAVRREYDSLCGALEADYARLRDAREQKAFAAGASNTRCSSPLFAMRSGKCRSVREFFAAATIQSVERALAMDLDALVAPGDGQRDEA